MGGWMKGRKGLCWPLPLGAAAAALLAFGASASAETMSEIDAFQRAVSTQSKQDALAFIDRFASSHLIPDLIELLRPEVAVDLCGSFDSRSPRVRAACDRVTKAARAVAVAPTPPRPSKTSEPASPTPGPSAPTVVARPSAADTAAQTASLNGGQATSQPTKLTSSQQAVAAPVETAPPPGGAAPAFVMLPGPAFVVVGASPAEPASP